MIQLIDKIRSIVADSLDVPLEKVRQEANLMKDLGAESIDFLDIMFRIEQEIGVVIPQGQIEKLAKNNIKDEEFAIDHRIQPAGLKQLREAGLALDERALRDGLKVEEIPSLFTVATIARLVELHQK